MTERCNEVKWVSFFKNTLGMFVFKILKKTKKTNNLDSSYDLISQFKTKQKQKQKKGVGHMPASYSDLVSMQHGCSAPGNCASTAPVIITAVHHEHMYNRARLTESVFTSAAEWFKFGNLTAWGLVTQETSAVTLETWHPFTLAYSDLKTKTTTKKTHLLLTSL